MKCLKCGSEGFGVVDSRTLEDGVVRRRRRCYICGHRQTYYEVTKECYMELRYGSLVLEKIISYLEKNQTAARGRDMRSLKRRKGGIDGI